MKKFALLITLLGWGVSPAAFASVPVPALAAHSHVVLAAAKAQSVKTKKSHKHKKHSKHARSNHTVGTPAADAGNTSAGDTLPPVEGSGESIVDTSGGPQ